MNIVYSAEVLVIVAVIVAAAYILYTFDLFSPD